MSKLDRIASMITQVSRMSSICTTYLHFQDIINLYEQKVFLHIGHLDLTALTQYDKRSKQKKYK